MWKWYCSNSIYQAEVCQKSHDNNQIRSWIDFKSIEVGMSGLWGVGEGSRDCWCRGSTATTITAVCLCLCMWMSSNGGGNVLWLRKLMKLYLLYFSTQLLVQQRIHCWDYLTSYFLWYPLVRRVYTSLSSSPLISCINTVSIPSPIICFGTKNVLFFPYLKKKKKSMPCFYRNVYFPPSK